MPRKLILTLIMMTSSTSLIQSPSPNSRRRNLRGRELKNKKHRKRQDSKRKKRKKRRRKRRGRRRRSKNHLRMMMKSRRNTSKYHLANKTCWSIQMLKTKSKKKADGAPLQTCHRSQKDSKTISLPDLALAAVTTEKPSNKLRTIFMKKVNTWPTEHMKKQVRPKVQHWIGSQTWLRPAASNSEIYG